MARMLNRFEAGAEVERKRFERVEASSKTVMLREYFS